MISTYYFIAAKINDKWQYYRNDYAFGYVWLNEDIPFDDNPLTTIEEAIALRWKYQYEHRKHSTDDHQDFHIVEVTVPDIEPKRSEIDAEFKLQEEKKAEQYEKYREDSDKKEQEEFQKMYNHPVHKILRFFGLDYRYTK